MQPDILMDATTASVCIIRYFFVVQIMEVEAAGLQREMNWKMWQLATIPSWQLMVIGCTTQFW